MTGIDNPGEIPQSPALSEADAAASLAELMSRDPEGYSGQDLARIISALRADRERREKAEAEVAANGGKKPKAIKAGPQMPVTVNPEDIGL